MEEIYILSDGSTVDLTNSSQFERTNFLIKNPFAKKQTGVAKSAGVTSKKKKAQSQNLASTGESGSLDSKKFRIPTNEDVEEMERRGILPPPSTQPSSYIKDYRSLYDLKQNEVKLKNYDVKTFSVKLPGSRSESKIKGKSKAFNEEVDDFAKKFRDNPLTGELGEDNRIKILDAKEKIRNTDSDLANPYLYYSSVNQGLQDDFIDKNYNKKELQALGINTQDFEGFLNKKGYKNDFLDKQEKGLFDGKGRDFFGGYDITLGKELAKKKLLNMYMEDMQHRDFTKQDLNQDIEIAYGVIKEKNIKQNQLFDQNGLAKYVENNFPTITKKLKDRDVENAKIYEKSKSGGTDFFSWETPGKIAKSGWNSIVDRVAQLSSTAYDVIGMDATAEGIRMLDEENKLIRPDDRGISYVSGKSTKYNGTNYIVDSRGQIYDTDSKIRVTDIFDKKAYDEITNAAKFGPSDWTFSIQGAAVQTSGVIADMVLQAALTRGVGELGAIASESRAVLTGVKQSSKLTSLMNDTSKLLNKVPIKRAEGYSMIAQSTLGYSQGYEQTLKAARDNGINDKEAFKLANAAGQRMAVLYGTTGIINPQTGLAENVFGSKNIIKKAIEQYTKTGEKGFVASIDDIIKNTPRNLIDFAEQGGREVVQENIQQIGEVGINKMTNYDAGKKILNEVMTGDDFMNTSILSFISSGLISKAKLPSFNTSNDSSDNLTSLNTLAKNKQEFDKVIGGLNSKGVFTDEEVAKLKNDVEVYSNNINKLPKNISPEIAMPVMIEQDKINKLEEEKKRVGKAFHEDIDISIQDLNDKIDGIVTLDKLKKKNEVIASAIKKGVVKNSELKTFSNTEEIEYYLVNTFKMNPVDAKENAKQKGLFLQSDYIKRVSSDPDSIPKDMKFFFVNEDRAVASGDFSTGQHEFAHGIMYNTLKDDPETAKLLGSALTTELLKLQEKVEAEGKTDIVIPEEFKGRFNQYVKYYSNANKEINSKLRVLNAKYDLGRVNESDYNKQRLDLQNSLDINSADMWEETITLYSDAISQGLVKYNESTFTKLKDVIRQVLQNLGLKDIKFESGKDVYNFIKDYNKSVETNTWGKAITKLGNEGAVVNKEAIAKETQSNKKDTNIENNSGRKMSLMDERKSSDAIKKDINIKYNKEVWSSGIDEKGENKAIDNVLFDILSEYDYIIKGKSKALGYSMLPDFSEFDMISETYIALIPHIRNFNKEFLQKREEFKKELVSKGLDPKSKEFKDKVEAQDEKGYKGKKGLVKENDDLNAWINSQLINKMKQALKSGSVTTQKFTEDIEGEMFKETSISDGFSGDEGYLMDEGNNIFEQENDFEAEQSRLAVLLSDPVYRFVDENGKPINIETVPFGSFFITEVSDPTIAANKKLKTETDPTKIADLKKQLVDLKRGLELQDKKDITFEEKEELRQLKSFKSYDLSTGMMVNTFQALSIEDTPAKIITDEVGREILRSPNIATLEYRNFKDKLSTLSKTMSRRMTFKNGPEIESLMYNQWELLYDVINHPTDPVTGQSSYASKKLPPRLKELDDKGDFKKIREINRVKFLQSYYGIEEASRIIKIYGNENSAEELRQFEDPEVSDKDGRALRPTTYFDRRTALMELFGDVLILQEARRLIRQPDFLSRIAERNVNLYNELKDDVVRAKVLNDMAKGKSSSVKFSLAEEQNGKISNFLNGLPFTEQWVVARDIDKAIKKSKIADGTKVTFKVPSRSKMSDKSTAYFIIEKVAEGYNDFEFRVKKNANGTLTKQVLDAVDFKSKKYQEIVERNANLERTMNEIIEENKGIAASETFSPESAKNLGKNIGGKDIFLPPEDEDFLGLLYTLASKKGTKGEEQLSFLTDNLLKPYSDAMLNLMRARQTMYKDWKKLINEKHKGISKLLKKDSGYNNYTNDQAVRVYLWSVAGYDIPGLDKKDLFNLREKVRKNKVLRSFAEDVSLLSKQANGYTEPGHNWGFGSVVGDINDIISKSNRAKYLEPWQHNIDKVFSKQNLSKIEAVYGGKYVKALNNILARMKTGSNRSEGSSDSLLNWLNGSTAVTMFFNIRSAVLQTIGAINYINTSDNNIIKAGQALLNVPQYIEDYRKIWNSDYLKDRRSGLMNDVAEAELVQAMNDSRNKNILDKFKSGLYWILKQGFLPTRVADGFAMSFGGAGFYRNRINTYLKKGETLEEAEHLAMRDFYETSEISQQSADVSKISMNQASVKGRLILAFQNTPLQYSRIIKKSVIDLAKGRGSVPNNIAKIVYYAAVQNIMFNFLQNALFASLFDDDDEQTQSKYNSSKMRALTGTMDTLLRGSGLKGALLATVKNVIIKWYEKSGDPKGFSDVLLEVANIAPAIGIKARALSKSYKAYEYNKDEINYKGFSLDNTYGIEALTSVTSAATNIPADRIFVKTQNVANALNSEYEMWQRLAFALGYSKWSLGLGESGNVSIDTSGMLRVPELSQEELVTPELK